MVKKSPMPKAKTETPELNAPTERMEQVDGTNFRWHDRWLTAISLVLVAIGTHTLGNTSKISDLRHVVESLAETVNTLTKEIADDIDRLADSFEKRELAIQRAGPLKQSRSVTVTFKLDRGALVAHLKDHTRFEYYFEKESLKSLRASDVAYVDIILMEQPDEINYNLLLSARITTVGVCEIRVGSASSLPELIEKAGNGIQSFLKENKNGKPNAFYVSIIIHPLLETKKKTG